MTGVRVLVVDDSQDVLIFVSALLEAEGFEVRTCKSAQQALDQVLSAAREQWPFGLLITDLDMPRERGAVLIKAVREIEEQAGLAAAERLPIILLTSLEPEDIPAREGADMMRLELSYLHKSDVSERLVPLVRKILGH